MHERMKPRKRAINLSVDADLLDSAKAAGTNLSSLLEGALRAELRHQRWQAWREQNREAIAASNRELAENGLWCDAYRAW